MAERTITIPDGNGNMVTIEAKEVTRKNTDAVDKALGNARENDFYIRVGHCTAALHKFLKAYIIDYGLTQEEAIAAVYLMNINNREFAPKDADNWPAYYDGVCQDIWNWFCEHKEE